MKNYDVIIVGGGPVGVALGIELGIHNVNTLIVEKHATPLFSPRAQFLNPRSVEFFRRWKLSETLNARQLLPLEYRNKSVWCSKLNGKTYAVVKTNEQLDDKKSPEEAVRIPLWITEEILRDKLNQLPTVTLLKQHNVTDIQDDENQIKIIAQNNSNELKEFHAPYVIACDGANSSIRKKVGIEFDAMASPQRSMNIVFESYELEKMITVDKGILFFLLNSLNPGAIGPVDLSRGLWYAQLKADQAAESIDQVDLISLLDDIVGFKFNKKIVQAHFWNMQIQLAKQFSKNNRVFLAGDSAHAFTPTGGYGLNTGLGDVLNLGWKLAAVIKNGVNPILLETYEEERRPICVKNLTAAQENTDHMLTLRQNFDPNKDPEGFAQANAEVGKKHNHTLGHTMGYAYFNSALTLLQENQPTDPMEQTIYHPTVAPGYFLPHIWIEDKKSIYDILSPKNWTLITSSFVMDDRVVNLQKQFKILGVTLNILNLQNVTYSYQYILIRPDWHIAWVSNELKNDFVELLQKFLVARTDKNTYKD